MVLLKTPAAAKVVLQNTEDCMSKGLKPCSAGQTPTLLEENNRKVTNFYLATLQDFSAGAAVWFVSKSSAFSGTSTCPAI
jgi:hypothetical protein